MPDVTERQSGNLELLLKMKISLISRFVSEQRIISLLPLLDYFWSHLMFFFSCSLKGSKSAPSAQRNHFKVVSLPPAGGQTGQRAVKEEKKHLCDCV